MFPNLTASCLVCEANITELEIIGISQITIAAISRHAIAPIVKVYLFDQINEALEHLRSGKACYRAVLKH